MSASKDLVRDTHYRSSLAEAAALVTAEEKTRILAEYEAAQSALERAALMRR